MLAIRIIVMLITTITIRHMIMIRIILAINTNIKSDNNNNNNDNNNRRIVKLIIVIRGLNRRRSKE